MRYQNRGKLKTHLQLAAAMATGKVTLGAVRKGLNMAKVLSDPDIFLEAPGSGVARGENPVKGVLMKTTKVSALALLTLFVAAVGCRGPATDAPCAFQDASTEECVVRFACEHDDPELCDVIIQAMEIRHAVETPASPATSRACDNKPILCTCCDVKNGCYPCPKKVVE